jgi:hypothetical protein
MFIYFWRVGKTENFKFILTFLLLIWLPCSIASANVSYSNEIQCIEFSAPYNSHDIPSLYSELIKTYNETYVKQNILNQISPGIWWCTCLQIPKDCDFYINSSTCKELRLMNSYNNWAISYYAIINNTKLIGWNRAYNRPNDYSPAQSETAQIVLYNPVHDVEFDNFREIYFGYQYGSSVSKQTYYNLSFKNLRKGVSFRGDHLIVNNISITDGSPGFGNGLFETFVYNSTFSNIYINNVSNPVLEPTGAYGIQFFGSDNILKDVSINGTGWSGTNIGGADEVRNENITVKNLTMNNAGHNGFEVECNYSKFENITVYNSHAFNFFQVGREETNKTVGNNIYENIHSFNPGSLGIGLQEGSFNTLIYNSTFDGKGIYFGTANNCTAINCTQANSSLENGNFFASYGTYAWYRYNVNCSFIDCSLKNNSNLDIHIEDAKPLNIINTYYSNLGIFYDGYGMKYYYADILVTSPNASLVNNATININCETNPKFMSVNGNGKYKNTFPTINGRSFLPYENRINSPAIASNYINKSGSYNLSHEVIVTSPNGTNISLSGIIPDSSWYRKNPNTPTYTITVIVPEKSSKKPNIIGFAPSDDNPLNPGDKKDFRIWVDGPLTSTKWVAYDEANGTNITLDEGNLNCTWTVNPNFNKIIFSGVGANGIVSHVWNFEEKNEKLSPYDMNNDGTVDPKDINIIAQYYGTIRKDSFQECDVNQDGVITFEDLVLTEYHFS